MSSQSDRPFAELPAALVEELLERATETGSALLESLRDYRANTDEIRSQLDSKRWLQHESELPNVHIPTTCGVDGSFAIERLLSTDLVAGAAVAMEGLTPPSEIRHWPEDLQYTTFMETEMHAADTGMIAWGDRMSEPQRILLAAYVASLRGSKPLNPKAAEGESIPAWVSDEARDTPDSG